ncbi:MAG: glycoside hydrolase family 38 C-terminal domain-containing protein [Anaerolineae bacterium]
MHQIRLTADKIKARLTLLRRLLYRECRPLPPFRVHLGSEPLVAPDVDDSAWPMAAPGNVWGVPRTEFTLRTTFCVPDGWADAVLSLPIGVVRDDFVHPEALTYIDGRPWMGVDQFHYDLRLPPWAQAGEHTLALYGWYGRRDDYAKMGEPSLSRFDSPTRELYIAGSVALETALLLDKDDPTRHRLLNALDHAVTLLNLQQPIGDEFYASARLALAALEDGLAAAGPALDVDVVATGHAHIDVAWLWPLRQTRLKTARSFSNVLGLMREFPEFHFTQSQPQLYAFLQQDYPEIFEGVKAQVAAGRWEPTGGMWIEADCNISGGEALVRQVILGRRYFQENLGTTGTPILWMPDTFGFPWCLPQLIKGVGLEYFMTSKMSWSQYNWLPYDSFWWQGLDGTRVLSHFLTGPSTWKPSPNHYITTYNAELNPWTVHGAWTTYQQKEGPNKLLVAYGHGDGGGGPTREMIEMGRREAAHPGLPRVRQSSAHEFFQGLAAESDGLPVWNGELYLEYHRGTYTGQARVKRANRKNEIALHTAEFLAAWATVVTPPPPPSTGGKSDTVRGRGDGEFSYPHADLRHAWQLLCLNQFHDILPGSSIGAVYEESLAQHADIARIASDISEAARARLAELAPQGAIVAANPTSFWRREPVFVPEILGVVPLAGSQPTVGGFLVAHAGIPPYGVAALTGAGAPSDTAEAGVEADGAWLENGRLRVELDASGDVHRVYDKQARREVLAPGQAGNVFQAFEDRPLANDAWDIDIFYTDKMWPAEPATSIQVVESGPLRATLEIRRQILHSATTQRVSLTAGSPRLDFDTHIDWRERQTLLKVAFPVDILASHATYDIQFGNIARPTHANTSWDWARFEVCAHKWADLSEGDYGVSLLNDCKYGHDIHDNVLRLTLLKSAISPDPEADQGEHTFRYSLLPHVGDWRGATVAEGYAVNVEPVVWAGQGAAAAATTVSLVAVDRPGVVIETVKAAEDGRGLIVRLYESQRGRGEVTLETALPLAAAERTNLVEDPEAALAVEGHRVRFPIRPYEIVTLRLIPA